MVNKKNEKVEEKESALARILAAMFFVLVVFGGSFLLWQNYHVNADAEEITDNSNIAKDSGDADIVALLDKVSKHILLPNDEEPTIATIVDADKLRADQAFYKNVKNGDKVLIYMKAQKAIIYREADDLLVNVGPVYTNKTVNKVDEKKESEVNNINENKIEQSEEALKIEIRNGSGKAGLAGKLRDKLKTKSDIYNVIDIGDASKKYDGNYILVDLSSGNKEKQIQNLLSDLAVKQVLKEIPEGEKKTDAELLIIIGQGE